MLIGRNEQPSLRHQGQQADCFQRHRLAAGVGASDQEYPEVLAQFERGRHHGRLIEQRVPGIDQPDPIRRVTAPVPLAACTRNWFGQGRPRGLHRFRQARLGDGQVDRRNCLDHA